MRLAWTLPWYLFKRNNCETPHWEQDFPEARFQNLPALVPPERKGSPLKASSRREMGTLRRRKIPGSCKPTIILSVWREDGLLTIQQWRLSQQIQGFERQIGAREWSFQVS